MQVFHHKDNILIWNTIPITIIYRLYWLNDREWQAIYRQSFAKENRLNLNLKLLGSLAILLDDDGRSLWGKES